jgi:hypothetical protein
MRSVFAGIGLALILFTTPSWAQSLTPITGWIPLDSAKAKALAHDDVAVSANARGAIATTNAPDGEARATAAH